MADEKIVYSVTLKLEKTFEIPVSVSKDELIDILVNNELDTDYLESDDFEEEKRESLFAKLCFALDMKVNHATPQHGPTFESLFNVNGER